MISFSAGTAAVATRSKKIFTGFSSKLKHSSNFGVANSTKNPISTVKLMSAGLYTVELDVEKKRMKEIL